MSRCMRGSEAPSPIHARLAQKPARNFGRILYPADHGEQIHEGSGCRGQEAWRMAPSPGGGSCEVAPLVAKPPPRPLSQRRGAPESRDSPSPVNQVTEPHK